MIDLGGVNRDINKDSLLGAKRWAYKEQFKKTGSSPELKKLAFEIALPDYEQKFVVEKLLSKQLAPEHIAKIAGPKSSKCDKISALQKIINFGEGKFGKAFYENIARLGLSAENVFIYSEDGVVKVGFKKSKKTEPEPGKEIEELQEVATQKELEKLFGGLIYKPGEEARVDLPAVDRPRFKTKSLRASQVLLVFVFVPVLLPVLFLRNLPKAQMAGSDALKNSFKAVMDLIEKLYLDN